MDVEMPKMDRLTFLETLMRGRPMPIVIVSSLTEAGCPTTLRVFELGAVDYITKPKLDLREGMREIVDDLIEKVKLQPWPRFEGQGMGLPIGAAASFATVGGHDQGNRYDHGHRGIHG